MSKARDYLDFTAFSHSGLIDQLEYEGFTTEDATWAADNCGADWMEQASLCAQNYLDFSDFTVKVSSTSFFMKASPKNKLNTV